MKYLFLINNATYLVEFFSKIARQLIEENNQCVFVLNTKLPEYQRGKFFPKNSKIISKVDWCIDNYNASKKEFDNLSWRDLFVIYDRFKMHRYDYEKSLEAVNQVCQFLKHVFENEKPDFVIGEAPAGLFGLAAFSFCKKNNIPFCGMLESRLPGRTDAFDSEWTFSKYEQIFKDLKKEDILPEEKEYAENYIKNFLSHKALYTSCLLPPLGFFNFFNYLSHYLNRAGELAGTFGKYVLNRKRFKDFDYESESVIRHSIRSPFRTIEKDFKLILHKRFFDKPITGDKYFFFPLQYEPEASTLVLATYYANQLATIKNTAATLPFPYRLYLKEHPASLGTRSADFYKEIKKLPNVVLLSPSEPIQELIKNCQGVITVTSTAGMEAALSGKPVYVLGNVFYSYHPLCKKPENFYKLSEMLKECVKKPIFPASHEDDVRFIVSYYKNSISADILLAPKKDDKNDYKLICQQIKKLYF